VGGLPDAAGEKVRYVGYPGTGGEGVEFSIRFVYGIYIRSIRFIYGYTPYISWQYTPRNIPTGVILHMSSADAQEKQGDGNYVPGASSDASEVIGTKM
jgi:hypothetical protein